MSSASGGRPASHRGFLRRRLHVAQAVAGRPRDSELLADRVQPILVEQHLAAIGRRHVERLHHDDRVRRAHLHAELAELARVELEREVLRVVALSRLQHLDLDDRGGQTNSHSRQPMQASLAGVRFVHEREQAAIAIGIGARLVRDSGP
jgi:hypothetical protein